MDSVLLEYIEQAFDVFQDGIWISDADSTCLFVNKKYEELESERIRLMTELEKQLSLKNVEEYAATQLGMEKLDPDQIEYVTLTEGNPIEKKEEADPSIWQKIKNFFNCVFEWLNYF